MKQPDGKTYGTQRSNTSRREDRVAVAVSIFCILVLLPLASHAGLTQDVNGWSSFTPSNDSRLIYVAKTGGTGNCAPHDDNDAVIGTNPFNPANPAQLNTCRSIGAAKGLMRDGFPDWMLFRKGDTWTDEVIGNWCINGRSPTERHLISAYGSGARPLIRAMSSFLSTVGAGGCTITVNHYAIVGLHLYAYQRDWRSSGFVSTGGSQGIFLLRAGQNVLIEDNKIQAYCNNINIQSDDTSTYGRFINLEIRRNVIIDSYSCGGHAQAIYVESVDGLLIEGNVLDHNGWGSCRDGCAPDNMGATIFNHNIYLQSGQESGKPGGGSLNVDVKENIIMRGSSHGMQVRPGGVVTDNFLFKNAVQILVKTDDTRKNSVVRNNVLLEAGDVNSSVLRGFGIDASHDSEGSPIADTFTIDGNIVAHDSAAAAAFVYCIQMFQPSTDSDFTITGNTCYDLQEAGGPNGSGNITTEANNIYCCNHSPISGSNRDAGSVTFNNPNLTVSDYNLAQGGAGTEVDFLAALRGQSKENGWYINDNSYTALHINQFIRDGFIEGNLIQPGQNIRIKSVTP